MKKLINPSFIKELKQRIDSESPFVQVLLGPRQVGKTTTVLKMIEEFYADRSIYVSADQVFNSEANWLRENWIEAQRTGKILFIDEIQKVYNWAEAIKSLYDDSKRNKNQIICVLLGSSSLEIQKGLSESLTGRFQLIKAHHWNYRESQEGYDLSFENYLKYGGYPGSYEFINGVNWASYIKDSIISTVVEKDILQYRTVKNPALFRQAFDIIMGYPAQEISYTKLLGQLQDKGNVEIVKYYLSLYEGAFLLKILEKFSGKIIKSRSSSPKILPLAPCLYYLNVRDEYKNDERGRVFELLVGAQLVRTGEDLFYWREGTYEVDYVLKIGRQVWAIEVKSGRKRSGKGLEAFNQKFPNSKQVIITEENYFEFESNPLEFLRYT